MKKILLSTILISSVVSSQLLAADVIGDNVRATAGDVYISDNGLPGVKFTDNPSVSTSIDWSIFGYDDELTVTIGTGGSKVMSLSHDTNAINSLIADSSGDINLANGSVFIDRSTDRLGIGTTTPAYTLDAVGDIKFGVSSNPWYTNTGAVGLFFGNSTDSITYGLGIANSAPTYTLMVGTNTTGKEGYVGIGTNSPQAKLDVRGDIKSTWSGSNTVNDGLTTLATLSADNSAAGVSDAGFRLINAKVGFQWDFRTLETAEGFAATKLNTGGPEFRIDNPTSDHHNAKVSMGGVVIFENGQLQTPSSRALKTNIKPLDTQAALEAFHDLQPVSYAYKAHKDEAVVGFIAEDIPELVATKTRTGIDATEIVAVLTSVLAETRAEMKAKDDRIVAMEAKITKLELMQKRLAKVESLLTNLALDTSNSKKEKVSLNTKP